MLLLTEKEINFKELSMISSLKTGDEKAFNYIFQTYYSDLFSYANKILNDKEEAKEVLQNVYFKLWEKRNKLDINRSVKCYLFKSIYNECMNKIKHQKIHYKVVSELQTKSFEETNENKINFCGKTELVSMVKETINLLPPKCKTVFILSRVHQLKNKEIAKQLNISHKTVENHITKALKVFRITLFDYIN